MKKLAFILFFFVAFTIQSQQFTTLLNAVYTSNTNGTALAIASDNAWSVQLVWTSATGTVNGVVYIEVSDDGANWIAHSSTANLTMSGASGSGGYDTGNVSMSWRFVRARYVKGTTTSANIKVYFNQLIKKTN